MNKLKKYNLKKISNKNQIFFKDLGRVTFSKNILKNIQFEEINEHIRFLVVDLFCGAGGTSSGFDRLVDEDGNKLPKVIADRFGKEYLE